MLDENLSEVPMTADAPGDASDSHGMYAVCFSLYNLNHYVGQYLAKSPFWVVFQVLIFMNSKMLLSNGPNASKIGLSIKKL